MSNINKTVSLIFRASLTQILKSRASPGTMKEITVKILLVLRTRFGAKRDDT